jgi:hypothetical protein
MPEKWRLSTDIDRYARGKTLRDAVEFTGFALKKI